MKNKEKSIPRNKFVDTLIDFKSIENDKYIKTSSGYAVVIKITGIDIFGYNEKDQNSCYDNFAKAELALKLPHKYMFYDEQPSYKKQKEYINYKIQQNKNDCYLELLNKQLELLDTNEKIHIDRCSLVVVFGKSIPELDFAANKFIERMKTDTVCDQLQGDNLVTTISQLISFKTYDENQSFIENICPESLEVSSSYLKTSDKYITSLVAYSYKSEILNLCLANMLNFNDTIATFDVAMIPKDIAKQQFSKSLNELNSRQVINNNAGDVIQDSGDYGDIQSLYDSLTRGNEQIMSATMRIYLSADTKNELFDKVKYIKSEFDSEEDYKLAQEQQQIEAEIAYVYER